MSLLLKAAVFGGIAYAITRALRNPSAQDALHTSGGSFDPELQPDDTQWPSSPQRSNLGPSS